MQCRIHSADCEWRKKYAHVCLSSLCACMLCVSVKVCNPLVKVGSRDWQTAIFVPSPSPFHYRRHQYHLHSSRSVDRRHLHHLVLLSPSLMEAKTAFIEHVE